MMRRNGTHAVCALLALILFGASGVQAVEIDGRAVLGFGRDGNTFREADPDQDAGGYFPYDLQIELTDTLPAAVAGKLQLGAEGGRYGSPVEDGSWSQLTLRADLERRFAPRLPGNRSSRLEIGLIGLVGKKDRTYYSRTFGEEFAVDVGDSVVALGDRYDSRFARYGVRLDWRLPQRLRLRGKLLLTRRNYEEDYESLAGVESYDYDARRLSLSLRKALGRTLRVELGGAWGRSDYDAWSARDFDGNQVAGETQVFDYRTWTASVRYRPSARGWLEIEFEGKQRRDGFLGYYDYDQRSVKPRLRLYLPGRTRLTLDYAYRYRDYERARVGFNPVKPLRKDLHRITTLRVERAWNDHLALIAQLSYRNSDEANPVYTYSRSRAWIGIEVHP